MGEKPLLVEYTSSISRIIYNTFCKSQRIKLTSFDVSSKFIVFGASTGGIYIFSQENCEFLKLIPSVYGTAIIVAISENEENLAVATSTGSVLILENCFNQSNNQQQQIFNEHYGQTITTIKWNNYDIYCGDNNGKVSVITIRNFLGKSIFQPPVACLMHLESTIIQIDTYSKLLLISTRQRTLLCDTETEYYKQIGKKSRDGPYGACFFNIPLIKTYYELPQKRGIFRLITSDDDGGGNDQQLCEDFDGIIVYCARPGVRLWQANCQGDVVLTHQFRTNLIDKQSEDLLVIDDCKEARLQIKQFPNHRFAIDSFNFGKIYNFLNRYIFTYNKNGFYLFDPKQSDLLLWLDYYKNIRDIKIVNSSIYLWYNQLEIAVLSLTLIDDLIAKSLYRKQYKLCLDLCIKFSKTINNQIDKFQQLSILETKLNDTELREIRSILDKIKILPKSVKLIKDHNGIVSINHQIEPTINPTKKTPYDIIVAQYKFNKINTNLETSDFLNLIETIDLNQIYEVLQQFANDTDNGGFCREIFLKILTKTSNFGNLPKSALHYISESFLIVNENNKNCGCNNCGFPLPKNRKSPPKFYDVGVRIMVELDEFENYTRILPYMNRYILENIDNSIDIKLKLPLIIQYGDIGIIEKIMLRSTYDIWDEAIGLLTKLKQNCCLYCNNPIDIDDCLRWNDFLFVVVQSINAKNTIELLKSYSNQIPKNELNCFFYQFCIFQRCTEIKDIQKLSFFKETIQQNDKTKVEFEKCVGGFLNRKYLDTTTVATTLTPLSTRIMSLNCDHCQMPLKTPIIDDIFKLSCSHNYHKVCYISIKEQCAICAKRHIF